MPVAGKGGGERYWALPEAVPSEPTGTGADGNDWARAVPSENAVTREPTINQLGTRRIIRPLQSPRPTGSAFEGQPYTLSPKTDQARIARIWASWQALRKFRRFSHPARAHKSKTGSESSRCLYRIYATRCQQVAASESVTRRECEKRGQAPRILGASPRFSVSVYSGGRFTECGFDAVKPLWTQRSFAGQSFKTLNSVLVIPVRGRRGGGRIQRSGSPGRTDHSTLRGLPAFW